MRSIDRETVAPVAPELLRPLDVLVPPDVADVIGRIGRTEDIVVSPDGTRLLIAGFGGNLLALIAFEIDVVGTDRPVIELTGVTTVCNSLLSDPHGIDFIDDTRVLVANRSSEVLLIEIPPSGAGRFGVDTVETRAQVLLGETSPAPVRTPGSLAIHRSGATAEVIVCNNYAHDVTRHVIDLHDVPVATTHEVLISSGLQIPDGVAISPSNRWLAVSNHDSHEVLIYRYDEHLAPDTPPCGRLRHVNYPHGLRFSADDRHVVVADAGLPYLHVYSAPDGDWAGDRSPARTVRVMDDATFNRGRYNPQEGGPKGLALISSDVVAVTSEHQTLAFFSRHDLFSGQVLPVPSDAADAFAVSRAARRASIAAHAAALALALDESRRLREEIADRDARISELAATVDSLRADLAAAAQHHIDQLDSVIAVQHARDEHAARQLATAEAQVDEAAARAARAEAESAAIAHSTAWRLTSPARFALDKFRGTRR